MASNLYVLDSQMVARPLTQFVDQPRLTPSPAPADSPDIPLSPDGSLAPGVVYDGASDPTVKWYLPTYVLNEADGRYTTSLKWRSAEDDPNGPLAFLEVELEARPPDAPGVALREIAHMAVVRLAYQLPVQAVAPAPSDGPPPPDAPAAAPAPVASSFLYIELGALNTAQGGARTCRLPLNDKADFDRIYGIMTNPDLQGSLEIQCSGVVGRRVVRRLPPVHYFPAANLHQVESFKVAAIAPGPLLEQAAPPPVVAESSPAENASPTMFRMSAAPDPVMLGQANLQLVRPAHTLMSTRMVEGAPNSVRAFQPATQMEMQPMMRRQPGLDDPVENDPPPIRHVPPPPPRPMPLPPVSVVLVRVTAETTQTVAPFCFPVATNAYMFDIPGDLTPTTNEILIPNTVDIDGVPTIFYQDSAFPDRFYYRPQQFRLARAQTAPFLPSLVFGFEDVSVDPGVANPTYRVQAAYRAAPWISPLALAQIRQQVPAGASPPNFLPLSPVSASVSLTLPAAGDDAPAAITTEADPSVTFDQGIAGQLELSPDQFKAFVLALNNFGIDGTVDAALIGSTRTSVPVNLSLKANVGHVFSRQVRALDTPGAYELTLTNDLESSVLVQAAHGSVVAPGVFATPMGFTPSSVQPGGTMTVSYAVQPTSAVVLDIHPDLELTIQVDPAVVLPHLMINEGYTSETFTLPVATSAAYFGSPAPDGSVLTGLQIEFDSAAPVQLTASALQSQVVLRMPLLPYLLNEANAMQYRYRVTSIWAAEPVPTWGTPGAWQNGEGNAALNVIPNPPG
jgi:hypothetical protein